MTNFLRNCLRILIPAAKTASSIRLFSMGRCLRMPSSSPSAKSYVVTPFGFAICCRRNEIRNTKEIGMLRPRLIVLIAMILAAAFSRLIPHPPNIASVTAVALFGGAYFSDKRLAFLVPLAALFLSDLVLGFYR